MNRYTEAARRVERYLNVKSQMSGPEHPDIVQTYHIGGEPVELRVADLRALIDRVDQLTNAMGETIDHLSIVGVSTGRSPVHPDTLNGWHRLLDGES